MKKLYHTFMYILTMVFIAGIFNACNTMNDEGLITDRSVNIGSFSVNGVAGIIDNETDKIVVLLPYGTPVAALAPQIGLSEGATSSPSAGNVVDFSKTVTFRVKNGNIYKDYDVSVKSQDPILSFKINGLDATINHTSKSITLTVPEETDLKAIAPVIEMAPGVGITPASGTVNDFTKPVSYTVSNSLRTEVYIAKISHPISGPVVAFVGTAATRNSLTNPDEIAAADWLFSKYSGAVYLSLADISAGATLGNIDVLWWHYDSATALPAEALSPNVVSKIKTYLDAGGNILLTSFAAQYVDPLGIVPPGKGPNNVFGDFLPNGFVDNNDWGISFVGNENHPIFRGIETYETGKANLLQKGTFRLNHTAWWFLPEWGGYGNGNGWRSQTGGNNLASEAWDNSLDGRVAIAEFPAGNTDKKCVVISMGSYDWYNETSNGTPSQTNSFIGNIRTITENTLNYLVKN